MNIKSTTRATVGCLAILLSAGLMKAQTVSPPSTQTPITEQNKAQWIQSNPEDYRSMGGQMGQPAERNGRTLPEIVSTVAPVEAPLPWGAPENKAAWIAANPLQYELMTGATPAVNPWGDPVNKAAWKNAHPAEFDAINNIGTGPVSTDPTPNN